jgi:tRNA splicing endonuclease
MRQKLIINVLNGEIFYLENIDEILKTQNVHKINGYIIRFNSTGFDNNIILILNFEEILLGLEFGFFKFKILRISKKVFQKYSVLDHRNSITLKTIIEKVSINFNFWRQKKFIFGKFLKRFFIEFLSILKNQKGKNCFFSPNHKKKYNSGIFRKFYLENFIKKAKAKCMLSYLIYKDLWMRGFYIACGIKFGSTFLIYSNLLDYVHSIASIYVIDKFFKISPNDLISFGRTGTTTKKITILAMISKNNSIMYTGFKWNPFLP